MLDQSLYTTVGSVLDVLVCELLTVSLQQRMQHARAW